MSPLFTFAAWCAGVLLGLIALVVVVDLIRGTLPPAIAVGAMMPTFGALMTAVVVTAKSDRDKED